MKIPVHYSLKVARKIASKIDLPKEIARNCTIKSWSNCREQGLSISRFCGISISPQVVFAQQRNSDDIMVISGTVSDFDPSTNQPREDVWKREGAMVHFAHNEIDKAAKHIEKVLTGKK